MHLATSNLGQGVGQGVRKGRCECGGEAQEGVCVCGGGGVVWVVWGGCCTV